MVERGIDALVVIGGDGSLTGANLFRQEWPELLAELVEAGEISPAVAAAHPFLRLVGLVGSIDNDMSGTDMTIGADTALHRIVEAMDALRSTASSHQRTFVVEVMGRHCGYLALMSSLATRGELGADPGAAAGRRLGTADVPGTSKAGRVIGRRQSVVIVAEGAQDRRRQPDHRRPDQDAARRRTRRGRPDHHPRATCSAAARRAPSTDTCATLLGHAAVERLLTDDPQAPAQLIGLRRQPGRQLAADGLCGADPGGRRADQGAGLRRGNVVARRQLPRVLQDPADHAAGRAATHPGRPAALPARRGARRRTGAGDEQRGARRGPARPGPRVHACWRSRTDSSDCATATSRRWAGWTSAAGCPTAAPRSAPTGTCPRGAAIAQIAKQIAAHRIDGLLMAGGWAGYQAAHDLHRHRNQYSALDIPIVCMPMTINNDVPGTELSIGSDTALNSIVADVDKIRQSAVATRRVFVVEVMGRDCGYLALLSGLATGAERVYLPEEGITLDDLTADVHALADGFRSGKRLGPDHPQRERRPRLQHRVHHIAVREGGRRSVRRPPGDPRARPGGRRPVTVRPDPGDQADRPLHRIPLRATGIRRQGQRDDRIPIRAAAVHRPDVLPDAGRAGRSAAPRTALDGAPQTGKDHAWLALNSTEQ